MVKQLCEPIVENGIQNTHFFNGRLLSAEDMQAEQQAQRQYRALLGQAIGAGVVRGLEVELADFDPKVLNTTLLVRAGLALNANGQTLHLPRDEKVAVIPETPTGQTSGGLFGVCTSDVTTLPTGVGLYLLLLAPASDFRGNAPMSGLGQNGQITGCGRRYEVEGVHFKLVKLNLTEETLQGLIKNTNLPLSTTLPATDPVDLSRLRNRVAYLCFGSEILAGFARDPFALEGGQSRYASYGLVEALLKHMRETKTPRFTEADVPLAVVYWTVRGLRFVDNWSVRRRPFVPFDAGPWGAILGERRRREAEAMFLQFEEHLRALLTGAAGFPQVSESALVAKNHFRYLPPAGILPLASQAVVSGTLAGVRAEIFFQGLTVRNPNTDPLYLEGAMLPALLRDSLAYPPIDLNSPELIWLYWLRDNQQAVNAGGAGQPRPYLVFANGHIPFQIEARFDLARLDFSRFA